MCLKLTNMKEKANLVLNYIYRLEEYRKEGMSYWDVMLATDLKDKDEKYINEINNMIDEFINNGKVAFCKKYDVTWHYA